MEIKGNSLLITGGASGIGRIMGRMALEKGARCVIIWDINPEAIAATEREFATLGRGPPEIRGAAVRSQRRSANLNIQITAGNSHRRSR